MKIEEAKVGTRVRSLRDFSGVPKGTEGVIDEDYKTGVMVAWDLKKRQLPKHWSYDCKEQFDRHLWPLRDGFNKKDELHFLEVVQ